MSSVELFHNTYPLETVGVHRELRYRWTEHGFTAYEVDTGSQGGIKSLRVLRTRDGRPVRSQDGVGDLIEIVEKLAAAKRLK